MDTLRHNPTPYRIRFLAFIAYRFLPLIFLVMGCVGVYISIRGWIDLGTTGDLWLVFPIISSIVSVGFLILAKMLLKEKKKFN